uniref:Uncharacterized protein n=1 Tax=Anopheles atroparvus TaxID=41427 RepID=A0AAG5DLX3_ANOAO
MKSGDEPVGSSIQHREYLKEAVMVTLLQVTTQQCTNMKSDDRNQWDVPSCIESKYGEKCVSNSSVIC